MRYYSDDGRILWDLAATGLDVRDVAKSQWNSVTGFPLPSGFSWLANGAELAAAARTQLLAAVSGSSVTLWRYSGQERPQRAGGLFGGIYVRWRGGG